MIAEIAVVRLRIRGPLSRDRVGGAICDGGGPSGIHPPARRRDRVALSATPRVHPLTSHRTASCATRGGTACDPSNSRTTTW